MRVRSSAAASRRSRSVSRCILRARSACSARRPRRCAHLVADQPCRAPHHDPEQDRRRRETGIRRRGGGDVHREHPQHDGRRLAQARAGALVRGDVEERHRRAEGRAGLIAEPVDRRARGGGHGEDAERRAPVRHERQRRDRSQPDAERIEPAGGAVAAGEQTEREPERRQRDDRVAGGRVRCGRTRHCLLRVVPRRRRRVVPREHLRPPAGGCPGSTHRAFRVETAVPSLTLMHSNEPRRGEP